MGHRRSLSLRFSSIVWTKIAWNIIKVKSWRILTFEGPGKNQSFSFAFSKVNGGYRIAVVKRKPKHALKFYSVEGSSVHKMRVKQNERHHKQNKFDAKALFQND